MRVAPFVAAVAVLGSATVNARVPDMACTALISVRGSPMQPGITQEPTPTDAFRMKAGRLYHKWKGREEYFYNDITEVDFRRYASGHMLFVLSSADSASGYVVIAGSNDWRVLQVQCKL